MIIVTTTSQTMALLINFIYAVNLSISKASENVSRNIQNQVSGDGTGKKTFLMHTFGYLLRQKNYIKSITRE